jgi:hypothetical protein
VVRAGSTRRSKHNGGEKEGGERTKVNELQII